MERLDTTAASAQQGTPVLGAMSAEWLGILAEIAKSDEQGRHKTRLATPICDRLGDPEGDSHDQPLPINNSREGNVGLTFKLVNFAARQKIHSFHALICLKTNLNLTI